MRIVSADYLAHLPKDDLEAVLANPQNTPQIRQAALQRWKALDDKAPARQAKGTQPLRVGAGRS